MTLFVKIYPKTISFLFNLDPYLPSSINQTEPQMLLNMQQKCIKYYSQYSFF